MLFLVWLLLYGASSCAAFVLVRSSDYYGYTSIDIGEEAIGVELRICDSDVTRSPCWLFPLIQRESTVGEYEQLLLTVSSALSDPTFYVEEITCNGVLLTVEWTSPWQQFNSAANGSLRATWYCTVGARFDLHVSPGEPFVPVLVSYSHGGKRGSRTVQCMLRNHSYSEIWFAGTDV